MTRAEEKALEIFPVKKVPYYGLACNAYSERDANLDKRALFCMGYEQAEKDLALSWEDIKRIDNIIGDMEYEDYSGRKELLESESAFYGEVLRRFREDEK